MHTIDTRRFAFALASSRHVVVSHNHVVACLRGYPNDLKAALRGKQFVHPALGRLSALHTARSGQLRAGDHG